MTRPSLSDILLIPFNHLSYPFLIKKFVSFKIVVVHVANVLSPATYNSLPLNGIATSVTVMPGKDVDVVRKDIVSVSPPIAANPGKGIVTLN